VLFGHDGCGNVPFSLLRRRLRTCSDLKQFCPVIQDAGMLPVSALSSCAWQAQSVKPCQAMARVHAPCMCQYCVLAPGSVAPSSGLPGWQSCCWRPKRQVGSHSAGSPPAKALRGWSSVPRRAVGSCSRHARCPGEHPRCYARLQRPPMHVGWH